MKQLITFFLFLPFFSFAQFTLIGKWQNTEFRGNDGAKDYINKIEDGRTYLFQQDGTVKNEINRVGTYQLENDILKISFPELAMQSLKEETVLYRIFYQDAKQNTVSFIPINDKHQFICIEACAEIFERRAHNKDKTELKIINANILDVTSGKILTNKTILISNEKIADISDSANHKSTRTIDAKGKLVTPGFIDPHIHPTDIFGDYEKAPKTLPTDSLASLRKKLSDEYLPFGTTTVMTMGQPETWLKNLLQWQKNPNSDNVDFIVCGGALISKDNRTPYIAHTEVTSPKLAMQKMLEYYDLGIRHVKLYHRLKEPEFSAVIKMADSLNIKTYGHIGDFSPEYLTISQTLEKGLKNYEHLALIPNSIITSDDDWAKLDKQFKENFGELNTESKVIEFFLEQFRYIKENKEREMQIFIQKLVQNKATFSTTLHRLYEQFENTYFTQIKDKTLTEKQVKRCKENFAIMMKYVKQMQDLGVEIRLGSDMPNGGKVNLSELIILSKYGFTIADIFKIASYNGAKAIGIENEVGNIVQGQKANLIIWSKNPFENPKNFISEKIIIKDGIQVQ
jgi:hypothetical protein